jgi:hypothetical protein
VDLARERRVAAKLDELGSMLDAHPDLSDRTAAMLRGALPCPDLEVNMPAVTITIRAPADLVERAEALRPILSRTDLRAVGGGDVSRGAVLRLALARGLDALEAEHGRKAAKGGARGLR